MSYDQHVTGEGHVTVTLLVTSRGHIYVWEEITRSPSHATWQIAAINIVAPDSFSIY